MTTSENSLISCSGANIKLVVIFCTWYGSSMVSSNTRKSVLDEYPWPLATTAIQFGAMASFSFLLLRVCGVYPFQAMSKDSVIQLITPLSLGNVFGYFFTAVALSKVPVSYSSTVKALSPLITVVLSVAFLGKKYPFEIYVSLVPIVFGVLLASVTEQEFDAWGCFAAIISAFAFVLQNLYSKHLFNITHLSHINLLYYASSIAFLIMLPFVVIIEHKALFQIPISLLPLIAVDAVACFGQTLSAFMFLSLVTPLTYSIANTFKKTAVIVASILYFRNPVSTLNVVGMWISLMGDALYVFIQMQHKGHKHSASDSGPADGNADPERGDRDHPATGHGSGSDGGERVGELLVDAFHAPPSPENGWRRLPVGARTYDPATGLGYRTYVV